MAASATNMTHTVFTRTSTLSPGLLHQHGSFSYQHDSNRFHQDFYTITRTLTPTWLLQLPAWLKQISPGLLHYHQDSYTNMAPSATNMTQTDFTRTSTLSPGLLHQHGSFSYQNDSYSFHQDFYTITRTLTPTWLLRLPT